MFDPSPTLVKRNKAIKKLTDEEEAAKRNAELQRVKEERAIINNATATGSNAPDSVKGEVCPAASHYHGLSLTHTQAGGGSVQQKMGSSFLSNLEAKIGGDETPKPAAPKKRVTVTLQKEGMSAKLKALLDARDATSDKVSRILVFAYHFVSLDILQIGGCVIV